ncbi:copper resistance protein CopC [Glycomyces sp. NPDC046736]|uniref:copper resistance CopC/CopD family protein n=1 Tax=Glycomyces sp. NPDC046736 TaxID=3155615 RepID=UPI0033F9B9D4
MNAARSRTPGRAVLLALAALVFALAPAAPANAHAALVSTTPESQAVLDTAPEEMILSFNEQVQPVPEGTRLIDGDGGEQVLAATSSDLDVVIDLPDLADGAYYVNWRVISADAHPISGVLAFTVGTGAAPPPPSDTAPAETERPWEVQAATVAYYFGLLAFAGYALFRNAIARDLAPARPRHRLLRVSGLVAILAAALSIPLGALELAGRSVGSILDFEAWTGTVPNGAIPQLVVTAVGIGVAYVGAVQRVGSVAVLGAAAAVVAPVFLGHSRGTDPRWLMLAADTVHLATAAIWVGGLVGISVLLVLLHRGRGRPRDAATVVARFSVWAGYSVLFLGASGLAMAWAVHRSWTSLFESEHGKVLLVKLGLVTCALALAGWNRYRLVPLIRRADARTGLTRLRRVVRVEAVVLTVIVAFTGFLVHLPPGAEPKPPPPAAPELSEPVTTPVTLTVPLGDGEAVLQGTVGGVGEHTFAITLTDAEGVALEPLEEPVVTASLPERDFGPVEAQMHEFGTGQFHSILDLPLTGAWQLTMQVRVSEFDSHTATFEVTVT